MENVVEAESHLNIGNSPRLKTILDSGFYDDSPPDQLSLRSSTSSSKEIPAKNVHNCANVDFSNRYLGGSYITNNQDNYLNYSNDIENSRITDSFSSTSSRDTTSLSSGPILSCNLSADSTDGSGKYLKISEKYGNDYSSKSVYGGDPSCYTTLPHINWKRIEDELNLSRAKLHSSYMLDTELVRAKLAADSSSEEDEISYMYGNESFIPTNLYNHNAIMKVSSSYDCTCPVWATKLRHHEQRHLRNKLRASLPFNKPAPSLNTYKIGQNYSGIGLLNSYDGSFKNNVTKLVNDETDYGKECGSPSFNLQICFMNDPKKKNDNVLDNITKSSLISTNTSPQIKMECKYLSLTNISNLNVNLTGRSRVNAFSSLSNIFALKSIPSYRTTNHESKLTSPSNGCLAVLPQRLDLIRKDSTRDKKKQTRAKKRNVPLLRNYHYDAEDETKTHSVTSHSTRSSTIKNDRLFRCRQPVPIYPMLHHSFDSYLEVKPQQEKIEDYYYDDVLYLSEDIENGNYEKNNGAYRIDDKQRIHKVCPKISADEINDLPLLVEKQLELQKGKARLALSQAPAMAKMQLEVEKELSKFSNFKTKKSPKRRASIHASRFENSNLKICSFAEITAFKIKTKLFTPKQPNKMGDNVKSIIKSSIYQNHMNSQKPLKSVQSNKKYELFYQILEKLSKLYGIKLDRNSNWSSLFSLKILCSMPTAQLQTLTNALLNQIEVMNEDLMELLMERDDLHMEQDSILVDIEDITGHFLNETFFPKGFPRHVPATF
ncbi:uncharacterized protein LOC135931120 isoform X2 [Gordionus sp. m RMFG-2023]|uniref:uncharacterized protein LOC135931120 isoform X2 n=1 Tax=Gordionus sp. m RMFG-2023 TaxID=3053472 RepID=UPI0031FC9314